MRVYRVFPFSYYNLAVPKTNNAAPDAGSTVVS